MMSSRKCIWSHGRDHPCGFGLTALPCSLLHRTQPFDRSDIRTANEFAGSQVGSQPRQTCGDARRRPATVAPGQCPGARCPAPRGEGPGPLRIEGVRGSNPLSSTSFCRSEAYKVPAASLAWVTMGSQSRVFQHRRPDLRAIPGCLPLRAEDATAAARNRSHQAGSGPSRWASSRHTRRAGTPARSAAARMQATANNACRLKSSACHQATTSSGHAGLPATRPLRPGQPTGAGASHGHGTSTREGTAPGSRQGHRIGPAGRTPAERTGAQAKEDLARERAVARMQRRQLAHKAEDAGIPGQPAQQNPAGGDPVPGARAASWQAYPDRRP